jgi:hypothetical protein
MANDNLGMQADVQAAAATAISSLCAATTPAVSSHGDALDPAGIKFSVDADGLIRPASSGLRFNKGA